MSATLEVDVAIVGAGPAGLAAASALADSALTIAVIDSGPVVGGQFWRHPADGSVPESADLHHDLGTYRSLRARLDAARVAGRLWLLHQHHVWTAERGAGPAGRSVFRLHTVDRSTAPAERPGLVRARAVLIATGAYDRQLPFPGWDLPGVLTIGAIQALLKAGGVLPGRRVALGGTGPFLLPVAAALASRGAEVVALCEANSPARWLRHVGSLARVPGKGREGMEYAAVLARHRIRPETSRAIVAAEGTDRVEAVRIAALDASGRVRPGTERRVACDAVGVGWGFVPNLDLALTLECRLTEGTDGNAVVAVDDWLRTNVPGVYAAGETTGVGGAPLALAEGELAARSILHDLAGRAPLGVASLRRRVSRQRSFAAALADAHPGPPQWATWLTDDTIVCRCEEITAGTVRAALAAGAPDHRQVKQLTRAGMGWCQGRMCGPAVYLLAAPGTPYVPTERLIAQPLRLGTLAGPDELENTADLDLSAARDVSADPSDSPGVDVSAAIGPPPAADAVAGPDAFAAPNVPVAVDGSAEPDALPKPDTPDLAL